MAKENFELSTWKELLGRHFPSKIKTRGNSYAEKGCVLLKHSDFDRIQAIVEGNISYSVEIIAEQNGNQFKVFCSCPYFSGGNACKHLWAAIVAADEAVLQSYTTSPKGAEKQISPDDWKSILNPAENKVTNSTPASYGQPVAFKPPQLK